MGTAPAALSSDRTKFVRIRVTVPGGDEKLELTLDGDLEVIDVSRRASESDSGTRRSYPTRYCRNLQ